MKLFKKKYERSEWFEGLLWAEHQLWKRISAEMFLQDTDGMSGYGVLWRNRSHEEPWCILKCSREFGKGVLDYLDYYRKYFQKT